MNFLHVAVLSAAGLAATAVPASADELGFGISFGGHRGTRGFIGVSIGIPTRTYGPAYGPAYRPAGFGYGGSYRPAPVAAWPACPAPDYAPPAAYDPIAAADDACRRMYVPPCTTFREETVCEPPVYEDRCVPVFEVVCIPLFETRCVPVFEDVCVPIFSERFDPVARRLVRVKVGERREHVQVGVRNERVRVGERRERVQVGTRNERVLVRGGETRTIRVPETVPGRYVWVGDDRARRHDGESMTEAQYQALLAQADTFSVRR